MGCNRNPGPVCQVENPVDIDEGTMCLSASPRPGPVCAPATRIVPSSATGHDSGGADASGLVCSKPSESNDAADSPTVSGSIPVGVGMASVVRIPVPGTGGLHVELSPRGYVPKSGSTSTLFIQDAAGKRVLRLDYGYNKATGRIDYHWNQKGTFGEFGIADHTPVGKAGEVLYRGARYFRYAGRVLLVVGLAADLYSIAVAKKRLRQATKVAAGWAGAWAGCEALGGGGAAGGSVEPGLGTAIGAIGGCIVGGIAGYAGASWAAGKTYDLIEETFFEPVPEVQNYSE